MYLVIMTCAVHVVYLQLGLVRLLVKMKEWAVSFVLHLVLVPRYSVLVLYLYIVIVHVFVHSGETPRTSVVFTLLSSVARIFLRYSK